MRPARPEVIRSARLETGASYKKNIQEKGQTPMHLLSAIVRNWPKVTLFYRELKDEGVVSHFHLGARCRIRRRQNLYLRIISAPRPEHAETTETIFAPDLDWPINNRFRNLLAILLPVSGAERLAGLYRDDVFPLENETDLAQRPCKRKTEYVRAIGMPIKMSGTANMFIQENLQFT